MAKQERRDERAKSRIPVRFKLAGESEPARGFTRDVSRGGLFIQTRHSLPPGSPIEVELLYEEHPVAISGVVVHAARVPPHLQAVHTPGMGVKTVSSSPLPGDTAATGSAGTTPGAEPDAPGADGADQRQDRVDPGTRVALFFGSQRRNLELRSLSASGAAVVSPRPLPQMPFVRLHFKLPGRSDLVVDGVPVRSEKVEDGTLLAIRFHDPPPGAVREIEAFVALHRERDG